MNSLWIALFAFVGYIVAYHTYGKFLARKVFGIDPDRRTPAEEHEDGVDYIPTRREILFGHHFTSIAGTGPIVGPAIAIIWGWVPALIWILLGSIFIGAVHDFGALVLSVRSEGRTIGELAGKLVNPRVKRAFLYIIFLSLFIVLAVFCLVIANIFVMYPQSVLAVWIELPIALWIGYMIYSRGANLAIMSAVALVLLYLFVVVGAYVPIRLPESLPFGLTPVLAWSVILFIYAFIASVLPVHRLLQPRDFINGHQLFVVMGMLVLGVLVARPVMVAPALNTHVAGAPPILPFVFITIACGAISGFHCMVSSGTTSKQLATERHAQSIGYGSMLMEGGLATLVIIACGAAIGMKTGADGLMMGSAAFTQHYESWGAAAGLAAKLGAFVEGSAELLMAIGIPATVAIAIMGVMVASFAGTTLDTATRLQRYVVTEIAADLAQSVSMFDWLKGRYQATAFAVGTAMVLAFQKGGAGGLLLWPLFGTANQLMGALALMVISVWLYKQRKPIIYTAAPMLFMISMTAWALIANLASYLSDGKWHLFIIGVLIAALEVWIVVEIVAHVGTYRAESAQTAEGAQT